jgi:CHAD domain-containing protein
VLVSIEIEDKFDVPVDFEIPELDDVRGCAEAVGPAIHQLVALYFDTPDLRLAAHGITLRRRRGGADAGWHLKLPKAKGVRQEITHKLTRSAKIVPVELAELVLAYTRGASLAAIAELATRRSVTLLRDPAGNTLVEVADDQVTGTVFAGEANAGESDAGPYVDRWREVEAELVGTEDQRLLKQVGKRLRKAGAAPAGSASKLARLLQNAGVAPEPARTRAPAQADGDDSAGEVVLAYLAAQAAALLAQDPRVRRAEDDAVHQMRVACRRSRSALKAFKTIVTDTERLQEELQWLGQELAEARDLEVIQARFARRFRDLPPELIVGPVTARLGADLAAKEQDAYKRIRETLRGDRYFTLLDAFEALLAVPSLTKRAAKPAAETLTAVAGRQWARVTKAYDTAQAMADEAEREIAMHDVRKAAKRARYTAEVVGMGKLAKRAEAVQESLGLYQDGVVAQELLAAEARTAREAGEDTFTYGVLTGLERADAERAHARFPDLWTETREAVDALL